MEEWDSDDEVIGNDDDETDDAVITDDDDIEQASSSSSTFLQQLVAQRTAFVQVKQEQEQQITMDHASDGSIITNNDDNHDPDGHLCVVCMDNERSCLYVPCNHLAVCAECDADIMAACLPCPVCNAAIDRSRWERGGRGGGGLVRSGGIVVGELLLLDLDEGSALGDELLEEGVGGG